jgi:uncharacterized protein with HEPN domain
VKIYTKVDKKHSYVKILQKKRFLISVNSNMATVRNVEVMGGKFNVI